MRKISYCEAINEATIQEMERDPTVFVYGIGVPDHKKIFGSTDNILEKFGPMRCFDTPIAEESMTGFGLGAAMAGLRPIHIHIRVDFLLLAMNQLVNMIATTSYGSGGKTSVPMVIRAVVGRGWGQGYQHSKSLHSYFAHIPGLKVILPTTPADAKGLLTSAIRDNNPVVCLEHRWLYWAEDHVPEGDFAIPIGQGNVLREGKDITIVATSWMNVESLRAADLLKKYHNIETEVVDPRSIFPLDEETIINSVNKTRKCLVADGDWSYCGLSGELASIVYSKCFGNLDMPIERIGFKHTPCPTVRVLENEFYPNATDIFKRIEKMFNLNPVDLPENEMFYSHEQKFKGPF